MLYLPLAPEPPLGELVETLFVLKGYQPEHEIERVIPDASCSLVIELDDQRRWVADNDTHQPIQECRRSWVSGPFQRHFSISARSDTELLAVRFRPGGIHPLLRSPVSEIRDRVVDASRLGVLLGVFGFGFYTSLAGQPILGAVLKDGETSVS